MPLILFIISSLFVCMEAHDIQVSFFKLYKANKEIILEITVEKNDLTELLKLSDNRLNPDTIKNYLNENLQIFLDKKQIFLIITKLERRSKHIKIHTILDQVPVSFKHIIIKNTFLLNIEKQSNIIQLRLQDKERDFLMNNKRKYIEIDL